MDVKSLNSKEEVIYKLPKSFTFKEIADATGNFMLILSLGESGFGKVYKGLLYETDQVIAVKQFDPNGFQGIMGFVIEVMPLIVTVHPNLVNLIGFCAVGDQRLLVYEFMPLGSLDKLLHGVSPGQKPLDWNTRMKIAAGTARGLEYLRNKKHPIICGDLRCSKILLGEGYHPKISGYGLAKVAPSGENSFHVSTKPSIGTPSVPGNAMTCQKTLKSDIYSFGVVLLELITGRKDSEEHDLLGWARPLLADRRYFTQMIDPLLQGEYPLRGSYQALATAAMCLQEQTEMRPAISDVALSLDYLASQKFDPSGNSSFLNTAVNGPPAAGGDDES